MRFHVQVEKQSPSICRTENVAKNGEILGFRGGRHED
jgi:hypothetical protein